MRKWRMYFETLNDVLYWQGESDPYWVFWASFAHWYFEKPNQKEI